MKGKFGEEGREKREGIGFKIITFPWSTCISSFLAYILTSVTEVWMTILENFIKWRFFTSQGAQVNCAIIYDDVIHPFDWKSAVEHDGRV